MIINAYLFTAEVDPLTPIVDMPLTGANGSTTFPDGTGRVWTPNGNAQIQSNRLALDGGDDYITTPGTSGLQLGSGDFEIALKIKTTQSDERYFLDFYTSGFASWQFGIRAGHLTWYAASPGGYVLDGVTAINDGIEHDVIARRLGGTFSFLIDGATDASVSDSRNYNYTSTYLAVGGQVSSRNPAYDFAGTVGALMISKG